MARGERRRRRVWSERLPPKLIEGAVLELLAARGLELVVAVEPRALDQLPGLIERCRVAGVGLGLWPLLDDRDGRWPSEANAAAFSRHLEAVLGVAAGLPRGAEVVFDLEPPIATTRRVLDGRGRRPGERPRRVIPSDPARAYGDMVARVRAEGLVPTAVVPPFVLFDPSRERGGWQRLLGTPVDGVGFARVSVMLYTSLLEGYSRGLLGREDARALLWRLTAMTLDRWGEVSEIALGVVGGGALGDERPYRDAEELADDVALARGAGARGLSLFDLAGLLGRREPPEVWLEAFVETRPVQAPPPARRRARAAIAVAASAGRIFEWAARRRAPAWS